MADSDGYMSYSDTEFDMEVSDYETELLEASYLLLGAKDQRTNATVSQYDNSGEKRASIIAEQRAQDGRLGLVPGPSSMVWRTAHGIPLQVQAAIAGDINYNSGNSGSFYLELQEANNICKAAFKEVIDIAIAAKTWVVTPPAFGSLEEFQRMFRSPPPSGMRVECSIESAIVPIAPCILISIMMDVDRWASSLSHIVYQASGSVPTGVLQQLSCMDPSILKMRMVNAEFQIPTPDLYRWKYCFLRWQREVIPNIWAILDLSTEYFPQTPSDSIFEESTNSFPHSPPDSTFEQNCRKRPSGVIIRSYGENDSQVIWIESVDVHECLIQDYFYSPINSHLAFCAKRWVSTLLWKLKRDDSRFIKMNKQLDRQAGTHLLKLTESMKMVYLKCVQAPDERKWVTIFEKEVRIMMNITADHVDTLGSNKYIALTSFRVQAKPLSVFHFLVKKNLHLQWPSLQNPEEPDEVIKFATNDDSNCITLHEKVVIQNESTKLSEYFLQEASWDGFCYFIISAPMTQLEFTDSLFSGRWRHISLQPSGFVIMPDGSRRLKSDASQSLVTIVMQQQLDGLETDQAIKSMHDLINASIREIKEQVTSGGEASS